MDKEELKRIIREVLEEFFGQHQEEWEGYWYKWVRLWGEKRLPPPPYWYPLISKEDVNKLRQTVSSLYEISESYKLFSVKLESWAPECSEKERIEAIETSVKNVEKSLEDIVKILKSK